MEETLAAIESANYALATALVCRLLYWPLVPFQLAARFCCSGSLWWLFFAGLTQAEAEGRLPFTYANTEEELLNNLTEDIDIVYIETPTNPLMVEFDIARISQGGSRARSSCHCGQYLLQSYLSKTAGGWSRYCSALCDQVSGGHNDVLAGAIMTNDAAIYDKLL